MSQADSAILETSHTVAPAHLVPLDHGWALWRSVCLRGAGFPATLVDELAAPECVVAIEQWLAFQDECTRACSSALQACEAGNQLGKPGAGSALTRAMKQLRADKLPEAFEAAPEVALAIEGYARARAARDLQAAAARAAFARAALHVGTALRRAAGDARLRVAMLWQNRGGVKGTVDALLRKPAGAVDSKTREHERLLASYLQRYCVKNDTIGFFGPVGWGTICEPVAALVLRPGPSLLAKRNVYFETWGVQLLAAQLSGDAALRRHIAPRRMPTVRLAGTTLFHSGGRASELPTEYARIVAACDGERSAAEIAALVCEDRALALSGEEEVLCLLEQLVDKRVLTWSLEIPTTLAHPDRALRALIMRAPPCDARARALAALDELDVARDRVAHARDDEAQLDHGLAALNESFERITETSAQRRAGQAYAGRTLLFEDCVRDVELRLGSALIEQLSAPLSLLLQAARWYTFEIGRRYNAALASVHARLRAESGSNTVELVYFLTQVEDLFTGSQACPAPIVQAVIAELHARWAELLLAAGAGRQIEHRSGTLWPLVERTFAAPRPGWPGARYHSPDLLIAAPSVEAINRGDYLLVMGELHTGDNTASNPVFIHQHPEPAELVRAVEYDLKQARICPVVPKERSTRADQVSLRRNDYDVEFGSTRSARPRQQVLAAADLIVEQVADGLYVCTRDRALRFHVLAFFENYLKLESIAHFTLLPKAAHSPRVTIDRLVVARERWQFDPAQLAFANQAEPLQRFTAARRWAAEQGLPRRVFAKIPEETKPCFVDFHSPVFVEILAKLARRGSALTISEMLPSVDDAWLIDHEGNAYTSELRLVAVDPQPWREP